MAKVRMGKIIGIIALVIGVISIVPSLVSGIGLAGSMLSIVVAGIAASMKEFKYSSITAIVITVNTFSFSLYTISNNSIDEGSILFFGFPYLALAAGYLVGLLRIRHADNK